MMDEEQLKKRIIAQLDQIREDINRYTAQQLTEIHDALQPLILGEE